MSKSYRGTALPRHFVFVTSNGSVAVQLNDNRAQDLYSGQILDLTRSAAGAAASDAELERLKMAGRVETYNASYVWVIGLPERHTYDPALAHDDATQKPRKYYVDTKLSSVEHLNVERVLHENGLQGFCTADVRNNIVIIRPSEKLYFEQVDAANEVLIHLQEVLPKIFGDSTIGFLTVNSRESQLVHEVPQPTGTTELAAIIASQTDTSATSGKKVVLLVTQDEDRILIGRLCAELGTNVQVATSGIEALSVLEDWTADLLVMDLQLPDMHGWEMLGKVREVEVLRNLAVIVIAEPSVTTDQSLSIAVAQVDAFLVRPLSKARIRQNIWAALKNRTETR